MFTNQVGGEGTTRSRSFRCFLLSKVEHHEREIQTFALCVCRPFILQRKEKGEKKTKTRFTHTHNQRNRREREREAFFFYFLIFVESGALGRLGE